MPKDHTPAAPVEEAGLAQVDPERPKVDGFAVEKAHVREVEGQNLLEPVQSSSLFSSEATHFFGSISQMVP